MHLTTKGSHAIDKGLALARTCTSRHDDQVSGTMINQPLAYGFADAANATYDQVGDIFAQAGSGSCWKNLSYVLVDCFIACGVREETYRNKVFSFDGDNNLAHVLVSLDESEGLLDLRQRMDSDWLDGVDGVLSE